MTKNFSAQKEEFADKELFYLGCAYKILMVKKLHVPFYFNGREFLLWDKYRSVALNRFREWYRQEALKIISQRVKYFADILNLEFKRLMITGAKTCLGSCGPKNTLNFSWRLVIAPSSVIDYVVVHELAHLVEHNHSQKFWQKVRLWYPDYRQAKSWLKTNYRLLGI